MGTKRLFMFLIFCLVTYSVTDYAKCTEEESKDSESPKTTSDENEVIKETKDVNSLDAPVENKKKPIMTFLDLDCKFCCGLYDYYYNSNVELFQANKNIGFETIIFGLETLWARKGEEYVFKVEVTKIYPNKMAMVLHLDNGDLIKLCRNEINGKWDEELVRMNPKSLELEHPSEISIITEKCPYPVIHKVNDDTKYDLKLVDEGYHFTFRDSAKVIKIKCGGTTLWERGNTDEQPLSLLFSRKFNKIVMSFHDWTTIYEKIEGRWTIRDDSTLAEEKEHYSKTFSERNLKLLTDSSPFRSDPSKYVFEKVDEARCKYKFKSGVKCREVRYAGMTVWAAMSIYSDYPREIYVNKSSKTVTLVGEMVTVYSLNEIRWEIIYCGIPNGLDLDISKKKPTNDYDYKFEEETNISIYRGKATSAFKSVKQRSIFCFSCFCPVTTIWEANGIYEFATKVVMVKIGSGTQFLAIYQIDGCWKKFKKTRKTRRWEEIDSHEKIPVYVNLESDYETKAYVVLIGFTTIFSPKEGFAFAGVYQWSGWCSSDNKTIWKAKNESEYSHKIVVEGFGKERSRVVVHLPEGELSFFEPGLKMLR
ncbi:conserved hypothetical protein [Theileria orientalis strain Shintoku]|uniref:SfiI-subtelomeric related protein family member n=1 Tax=Theileria orientalis strain Shintoku TaxID=869250 RepID=J4C327_THEOR|nr:conserved hypothetical protein [Theileria orientalis strain Shintoku]PVC52475.1 hypothetical protein MACL_00000731 [Theileria orientalis]BAM39711.1 conserved hypothetical protein [Theileria orientalis strain Shintoku]|eukprot:XP_009690012.1 conserved hypothetical protein [Theileria orientalis strain Shintoku]